MRRAVQSTVLWGRLPLLPISASSAGQVGPYAAAARALPTHEVRAHARRPIVTVWHHGPRLRPREQRPRWPGLGSDGAALGPYGAPRRGLRKLVTRPKPEAMGIGGVDIVAATSIRCHNRTTKVTVALVC